MPLTRGRWSVWSVFADDRDPIVVGDDLSERDAQRAARVKNVNAAKYQVGARFVALPHGEVPSAEHIPAPRVAE